METNGDLCCPPNLIIKSRDEISIKMAREGHVRWGLFAINAIILHFFFFFFPLNNEEVILEEREGEFVCALKKKKTQQNKQVEWKLIIK